MFRLDGLDDLPALAARLPRYDDEAAAQARKRQAQLTKPPGSLGRLEDLDRQVLELRLGFADGEPRSFAHTARVLSISASRVRRLEARALETLRGVCPQQASAHLSA